jgi:ligand-binding sensor domain-containing protein/serine phosphatase RsbU (regulator of sigma subunit)
MMRFGPVTYLLLGAIGFMFPQMVRSQAYTSTQYASADGFPNQFVYSIQQDEQGYLWVGTGEGLLRFNGQEFMHLFEGDSLAENFVSASLHESSGRIWYGHQNGGITIMDGKTFKVASNKAIPKGQINRFRLSPSGEPWFSIQGRGLVKALNDGKYIAFENEFRDLIIRDFEFVSETELLVATTEGVFVYQINDFGFPVLSSSNAILEGKEVHALLKDGNAFYMGTNAGLYLIPTAELMQGRAYPMAQGLLSSADVRSLLFDKDKNIWVSTWGKGLFKLLNSSKSFSRYTESISFLQSGQLQAPNINLVFQDREGTMWVGSHGAGLFKLSDKILEYVSVEEISGNANIYSLSSQKGTTIYGSYGSVVIYNAEQSELRVLKEEDGVPTDAVTCVYVDRKKTLWIGTEISGIHYMPRGAEKFTELPLEEDLLTKSINDITGSDQFIWIATKFGLYKYNTIIGTWFRYSTENELRHNDISAIWKDSTSNDLWVATQSNYLTKIRGKEITDYPIIEGNEALKITGIQQDRDGNIWISTYGDGVYWHNLQSYVHYGRDDGLMSDYCYGIRLDGEGTAWVSHRGGVSRIKPSSGQIRVLTGKDGFIGDCHRNAIVIEGDKGILFGTDKGLMRYYRGRDQVNTTPPKIDLLGITVTIDNEDQTFHEGPIELPAGAYRVRFDFIGLTFRKTEDVTYRYILNAYDLDTTLTNVNFAQYNRLEEGSYEFTVVACNSDGYCSEESIRVQISIAKPFYKRTWFLATTSAGLISLIFLVIRVRERQQKRAKEFLQRELDKRTHEVVEQRDELERKNKDITDSINYAKRIQSAIIPAAKKLSDVLPDSFIYFRPRDIVSGDFYWLNQYGDKLLIACADCTGHGVPGAFMSIIGSTVLQDTLSRQEVTSPTQVLFRLDDEIQKLLNAEQGEDKPRDGMDISVCEIDLKTREVRIASAMRPVFLYRGGEEIQVKGSRHPIGGGYKDDKEFNMQTYQMQAGDMIYMFSDGYADQFGGPEGKKLKIARMRELFEFMHSRPAEFQQNTLHTTLLKWMGDYKQVDDILVMGIRIK